MRVAAVIEEMVRRYPRRYGRLAAKHAQPGVPKRVLIEITSGSSDGHPSAELA